MVSTRREIGVDALDLALDQILDLGRPDRLA